MLVSSRKYCDLLAKFCDSYVHIFMPKKTLWIEVKFYNNKLTKGYYMPIQRLGNAVSSPTLLERTQGFLLDRLASATVNLNKYTIDYADNPALPVFITSGIALLAAIPCGFATRKLAQSMQPDQAGEILRPYQNAVKREFPGL